MSSTPFYEPALARIHHEGFGAYPERVARAFVERVTASAIGGVQGQTVYELGCGSGRASKVMIDAGLSLTGIDLSADMIRIAKRYARGGDFRVGSLYDAELPACDGILAVGEVFNYAADEVAGLRSLKRVFRRAHRALRDDGVLCFDLAEPNRGADLVPVVRHGDGWTVISEKHRPSPSVLERHVTSYVRAGRGYRRSFEVHRLRLFSAQEVAALLRTIGFVVQVRASLKDAAGSEPLPKGIRMIWARRDG